MPQLLPRTLAESYLPPTSGREIAYGRSPEFHMVGACSTCGDPGYPHLAVRANQIQEVAGPSALVQWIRQALAVGRGSAAAYDDQFGSDFAQLWGRSGPEIGTEIGRMVREAIEGDRRVSQVTVQLGEPTAGQVGSSVNVDVAVVGFDGQTFSLTAVIEALEELQGRG